MAVDTAAIAVDTVDMPDILLPHRETSVVGMALLSVVTPAAFGVGFMRAGLTMAAVDTMAADIMAAEDITDPASALEFIPIVMAM